MEHRGKTNKLLNVSVVIIVLTLIYMVFHLVQENQQKDRIIQEANSKPQETKNIINDQLFPLAGGIDNDGFYDTNLVNVNDAINENYNIYKIGSDPVMLDNGVKITTTPYEVGTEEPQDYYGAFSQPTKAKGKYIEIRFVIENTNKTPTTLNMSEIRLLTKDDKEYFPVRKNWECDYGHPNYLSQDEVSKDMNPDSVCNVKMLFDITTSTNPLMIKLKAF